METKEFVQILADQKEAFFAQDRSGLCVRKEQEQLEINSKLAQVVIGVRRCGKSTLCEQFLLANHVHFGYVNFDDEQLYGLKVNDLNNLLEALYIVYGDVDSLFFDEIQNVEAWPLFVNRLLRQGKHIFITGSNSKLLSNELMTHLTGRHNPVALFPFSFKEYCRMKKVDLEGLSTKAVALRSRALHDYVVAGGFPELIAEQNRRRYVEGLLNTIIRNDIAKRFRIRNIEALRRVAVYLIDNFGQEFVASQVAKLFGISNHTAENYYNYLKEAFLLVGVPKFSYKSKERIRNEKCYAIDVALVAEHEGGVMLENLGWKLENVVCVELLRRYKPSYTDVFYYKGRSFECDFVIAYAGKVQELIQVCYDMQSPKTRKREINGLIQAARLFNCRQLTLITFAEEEVVEEQGYQIHVVGAVKWLTADK